MSFFDNIREPIVWVKDQLFERPDPEDQKELKEEKETDTISSSVDASKIKSEQMTPSNLTQIDTSKYAVGVDPVVSSEDTTVVNHQNLKLITSSECIGLLKLALRYNGDTNTRIVVESVLVALQQGMYNDYAREFFNKCRKDTSKKWIPENLELLLKEVNDIERLEIKDMSSHKSIKISMPEELSLVYRQELLKSNLFIVLDSDKENVYIIKSRYFNTRITNPQF